MMYMYMYMYMLVVQCIQMQLNFFIIIIINEFHRDASLTKTSGPLCVTCFTSVMVHELLS